MPVDRSWRARRASGTVARMTGILRGLVAVLVLVCAAPAAAQDRAIAPEARQQFERATAHYEAGRYAQSLADFEQVHAALVGAGHPNAALVLFNIARCYQRLGRARESVAAFERFLAEAPEGAPNIEVARVELQELRARVALDGAREEEPAPSGPSISPVGPIVAAVGGAALIAGAITGALALVANADANDGCVDGHCPAALAPRADEAHLLANVTDGLLFGGLAVAAAGVVLIFVLAGDETSASAACTSDGCAAVIGGRF